MALEFDERGRARENEYFRRKEVELLAKMKAKLESGDSAPTELDCPKCEGKLHETNFENITIDVCNRCHGVWLDAGELAQVTQRDEGGWIGRIFG
ncbi:MAG: zf-TFIIB domain-containing protein [Acidobacteria bacterium]|nr:zf-TFIIB domain-containing protein [Acidobacteriota bacterium]